MTKKLLQIATKRRVFAEIGLGSKILITLILATPIILVATTGIISKIGIANTLQAIVPSPTAAPQAVITINQPAWFDANAKGPTGLDLSLTKGLAPFPVFFQGWQSSPRDEIVDYQWNFGDSNAYAKGNPNNLSGFNSAHVFEQPGTYHVTLTVKNKAGQTATASQGITVLPRSAVATAVTYYVDPAGNDSYTGQCQDIPASGDCGPWKTADKAFANLHAASTAAQYNYGDSILFKRGGRYPFNTVWTNQVVPKGLLFGAYGEGAKPEIYYNGSTNTGVMIIVGARSYDLAFVDLNFQFKNPTASARSGGLITGYGQDRGLLFLRLDAQDMNGQLFGYNYVVNATYPDSLEAVTTGVYMFDSSVKLNYYGSSAVDPNFSGLVMVYGYMGNMALVGNTFDKSWNHITYLAHLNKAVIVNNVFSRPAYGRNALRIDGHLVNGKGTNNVYAADNYILGWRDPISDSGAHNGGGKNYNYDLITIGPNTGIDQQIKDVIFERNVITNFEAAAIIADAENIIVRNNLFITPNDQSRFGGVIALGNRAYESRPSKNITIAGNTFIAKSLSNNNTYSHSAVININPYDRTRGTAYGLEHQQIKIFNNLIYRPAGSSAIITSLGYATPELTPQLQFDGNLYYSASALASGKIFAVATSTYYASSTWQELGYDAHSQFQIAPMFAQPAAIKSYAIGEPATLQEGISQADIYREMFQLKTDPANPAVDHGVDLGNLLAYDFAGVERPDGNWSSNGSYDVGAYELISNTPPPPSPSPPPPPSPCAPNWNCANWSACGSAGYQTRTCTDSNSCPNPAGKPAESQSCAAGSNSNNNSSGSGGGGGNSGGSSFTNTPSTPSPVPAALVIVNGSQGEIIKVNAANRPAVYYATGGKKYLFVNRATYTTWSAAAGDSANNFSTLKTITQQEFDNIPTGGNLVVKAGWMIKFDNSPIAYAVGTGGKLFQLADSSAQRALFGSYIPVVIQAGFRDNYYDHGNAVGVLTAASQKPQ
ncbi:MAG: PKD domain-containing protein [Candidatus Buchananbacteria bacterium]|jgi:hypothetical protein